ncbi:hypothetical protein GGU10DRAFT_371977 [Lentinula aff. detonsa]|uniref:F-box domain-containing protein n=1 Tax=Lentinula aff. detonsa TaxID=2804958 RepID=A0AA38NR61_9AGAR|nr:hypothetical protein GGU10DRAFT_371977 [Lentinula aff. detonsa]
MERLTGLLRLPDDIISQILQYSPSYSTLLSTLLTTKSFYRVFQAHPNSILHAINFREIGPSYPLSLRRVRYMAPVLDCEDADRLLAQAVSTDVICDFPITREERKEMKEMEDKVTQLEDLFSFRYLDRTSVSSQLTPEESWRFRRALHHLTLYTCEFPISRYPYIEENDRFTETEIQVQVRQENRRRITFLSDFSAEELLEISAVLFFLEELGVYVFSRTGLDGIRAIAIPAGPEILLACHYCISDHPIRQHVKDIEKIVAYHPFLESYIWTPLLEVLKQREFREETESDYFPWNFISNRIHQSDTQCHQCKDELGFDVWTRKTWTPLATRYRQSIYLPHRAYTITSVCLSMKDRLMLNGLESEYLRTAIGNFENDDYLTRILGDIYDYDLKLDAFADWDKDDLLCEDCFERFLTEHLHLWIRYNRSLEGEIAKDCPYGYRCKLQGRYDPTAGKASIRGFLKEHQESFNHLCAPIAQDTQDVALLIHEYSVANQVVIDLSSV